MVWESSGAEFQQDRWAFATIERACDEIRTMKKAKGFLDRPVRVLVRGGIYFLREPMVFTPEDSGTKDCKVTYMAYPDPYLSNPELYDWSSSRKHPRSVRPMVVRMSDCYTEPFLIETSGYPVSKLVLYTLPLRQTLGDSSP